MYLIKQLLQLPCVWFVTAYYIYPWDFTAYLYTVFINFFTLLYAAVLLQKHDNKYMAKNAKRLGVYDEEGNVRVWTRWQKFSHVVTYILSLVGMFFVCYWLPHSTYAVISVCLCVPVFVLATIKINHELKRYRNIPDNQRRRLERHDLPGTWAT